MVFSKGLTCGVLFVTVAFGMAGCALLANSIPQASSIICKDAEIFVQPQPAHYRQRRLAIVPFESPAYAPGVGGVVASLYGQELLRSGYFTQVGVLEGVAPSHGAPALWSGQKELDLVVRGKVLYVHAGAGGAPSMIVVESQIIDALQQTIVSYVRQEAVSNPGPDLNLVWATAAGAPALPYQSLAAALAQQYVAVLSASGEERLQEAPQPVESPFVNKGH